MAIFEHSRQGLPAHSEVVANMWLGPQRQRTPTPVPTAGPICSPAVVCCLRAVRCAGKGVSHHFDVAHSPIGWVAYVLAGLARAGSGHTGYRQKFAKMSF